MLAASCFVLFTLILGPVAQAEPVRFGSTLDRIEQAWTAGEISEEQHVLYRLYRVVDRNRLPDGLVAPREQEQPVRCGTPMVRAARKGADGWFTPEAAAIVHELLPRTAAARYETHDSDNFSLLVGDQYTGSSADIDFWLDSFETAWDVEVDQLGFTRPPCTELYRFDVQLANTGDDMPSMEQDVYGYCDHYNNDCPFVVVHADYAFTGNPVGAAQATAAHEFQHGIQSGYDWWEGDNWMEATATWAEDAVFDDANDYVDYLNGSEGWLAYPELALLYEDGWHEYGNVIWAKYLSENWGGDETIVEIWEGCRDEDMLTAVANMVESEGWSLGETFVDFTVCLAVGAFEEADLYDDVYKMGTHSSYPATGSPGQYLPREMGSNYVVFEPSGDSDTFNLDFWGTADDGAGPVEWGLALIEVSGGDALYQVLEADASGYAFGQVVDFGGSVDRVILAVSVLGNDGQGSAGVAYSYDAKLGEAPPGDDDDGAGDGEGCGCRVTGRAPAPALLVGVLAALVAVRRTRR